MIIVGVEENRGSAMEKVLFLVYHEICQYHFPSDAVKGSSEVFKTIAAITH